MDQPLADAGASDEQGWRACSSPAPDRATEDGGGSRPQPRLVLLASAVDQPVPHAPAVDHEAAVVGVELAAQTAGVGIQGAGLAGVAEAPDLAQQLLLPKALATRRAFMPIFVGLRYQAKRRTSTKRSVHCSGSNDTAPHATELGCRQRRASDVLGGCSSDIPLMPLTEYSRGAMRRAHSPEGDFQWLQGRRHPPGCRTR